MRCTRRPAVGAIGLALPLVATLAGCATYTTTSSPYIIKKGSGPVDAGHGVEQPKFDRGKIERAARDAQAQRAAQRPEPPASVERLDPVLRDVLAALERAPSANAHVDVGQQYLRLKIYDAAYDQFSQAIRQDG